MSLLRSFFLTSLLAAAPGAALANWTLSGVQLRDELPSGWPATVIAQVGNYGEIFDRNLGASSPIGIERGLNSLWNEGGLMYAPPFR